MTNRKIGSAEEEECKWISAALIRVTLNWLTNNNSTLFVLTFHNNENIRKPLLIHSLAFYSTKAKSKTHF